MAGTTEHLDAATIEESVRSCYADGAARRVESLCCPVTYDPALLAAIPSEVKERDYGCGDPTRHVKPGETVLDLGSGGGKACFLASQVVGRSGKVIGVDMNEAMLALARRAAPEVARRVGFANVLFRKGRIQDLSLDLDRLDTLLDDNPVRSADDLRRVERLIGALRREHPLIASDSIDVVVSNCVLNLVAPSEKEALFAEIARVLRPGGRAVISDIVSDEDIPERLQRDAELWSGCVSGALREDLFVESFARAGLVGAEVIERQAAPWRTVEGIELRSVTVKAYKPEPGPCLEQHHAVIYRGPFRAVDDDQGHRFWRGVSTAVCGKTFRLLAREPYRHFFELVPPRVSVAAEDAAPFPCDPGPKRRDPRETKAGVANADADDAQGDANCAAGTNCC